MKTLIKIKDIYRAISEWEVELVRYHGITINEGLLLSGLAEAESLTPTEISNLLSLSFSNTSKVIRSCETKKLIYRIMDKFDRRRMYFAITEKGIHKISNVDDFRLKGKQLTKDILNICLTPIETEDTN